MEAVLDVYARPYNPRFPVVNLDETPKQLHSQIPQSFVDSRGVQYQDYEYRREGVTHIYMIVEALAGPREVLIENDRTSLTYAKVVAYIVEQMYPDVGKITLIEDNLSTHKLSTLYEIFEPKRIRSIIEKLQVVRTPVHGSWLNIAACELSVLTRKGLKKRTSDRKTLEKDIRVWFKNRNGKQKKVIW